MSPIGDFRLKPNLRLLFEVVLRHPAGMLRGQRRLGDDNLDNGVGLGEYNYVKVLYVYEIK
jgi:hypothetical protein